MSSQQSLILPYGGEIFATSWLASISGSQTLAKSLKPQDLAAVNVAKTCDKLQLALQHSSEQLQSVGDNAKLRTVSEDDISFRTCTNLWYGTLKIHEHQVDTLLRESHDLVVRSRTFDVKTLESTKRKSSTTCHQIIKKRRLTIGEANDGKLPASYYSNLLDDLERLTQEGVQSNIDESIEFLSASNSRCTRPRAQLQIREITIREISATTYDTPDIEDEDTGFGEATHEEIREFFNYVEDNCHTENRKTATKRKTIYEDDPCSKQCRNSHDSAIEPVRNENVSMEPNGCSIRCPSLERPTSPASTIDSTTMYIDNKTFENRTFSPTWLQQNCVEDSKKFDTQPDEIKELAVDIKKEELEDDGYKSESNNSSHDLLKGKKKISKLIIDKCIKIDQNEMIEQMNCLPELSKLMKKLILKKFKTKKTLSALELLNRSNRRVLKPTLSLKQKISLKPEQFERDYLNLIQDILKTDRLEESASLIYQKWQQSKIPLKQKTSKRLNKSVNDIEQIAILNCIDDNLNLAPNLNNNNLNNIPIENQNNQISQQNPMMNYTPSGEWGPYGVMTKLLEIWRYSATGEINAIDFCNSANHQIEKALTFNSLLYLYKSQFIDITKFPQTIKMDKIIMGKNIKNMIDMKE